ncbi:MAG: tRNA-dihydrouridine synthase family protein [Proteobacteria bacterium]|nr:tRNA-dihydrouridine synthase family protein [Pseudomonadota bacterium]
MTESKTARETQPLLYLAPIRGVTDSAFRTAFTDAFGGFDAAVAPFVRVEKGKFSPRILKDLKCEDNKKLPVIPQILTRKTEVFVAAANALEQMGYGEINWNLGCPHPRVAKKGLGAGLVVEPQIVDDVLTAAFSKSNIKVSVKVRLGQKGPGQLLSLLPTLNRHALDKIIIHPRTAAQMYDGQVHLDHFEACLNATDHDVIYNGDIRSIEGFQQLQTRFTSVSGWMIGRGALENPLLAQTIKTHQTVEPQKLLQRLFDFHNHLYTHYKTKLNGDAHFLAKMRSIWEYMTPSVPNAKKFAKKIRRAKSVRTYDLYIEEFLGKKGTVPLEKLGTYGPDQT